MIISSLFFALNSSAAAFDSLIDLIRFFRNYRSLTITSSCSTVQSSKI